MAVNVFELFAKIGLDTKEYEENLGKSESKFKSFGKALGNGLKTAAKVGTAAIGTASAGIVALTKQAVESYAEYEQLVGGVETLYGSAYESVEEYAKGVGLSLEEAERSFEQYQNRQQDVLNNAANAYKTAGLSVNEYMNTVNGFAASLTSSLGEYEWQAANYADMIVTDMADNANKMGTSMEMIQNAYSGFAKGNFTMLDNLKLGYGGTKEEMERLLRKAEEIEGYTKGALSIDSFADIAEAINIVQSEMGITGTTAREAAETIAGSTATMKSAWQNLITGIADDNADFGQLIDNFVSSVGVAAGNILPRIETALVGVSNLIGELFPVIMQKIPDIIETTLPTIAQSAVKIIESFLAGIEQNPDQIVDTIMMVMDILIDSIVSMLPDIIVVGALLLGKLAVGIVETIPDLVGKIPQIVKEVVDGFKAKSADFEGIGTNIVAGLKKGISDAWKNLKEWFTNLFGDLTAIAKKILGIASPSKVFKQFGKYVDEGLAIGIDQNSDKPFRAIENVSSGIADNFVSNYVGEVKTPNMPVSNGQDNEVADLLYRLVDLFESGKAKMDVNNTRDLRRALTSG